ncbi:MAG: macro domain-containing protein, partial [Planctomycetota bacterium]
AACNYAVDLHLQRTSDSSAYSELLARKGICTRFISADHLIWIASSALLGIAVLAATPLRQSRSPNHLDSYRPEASPTKPPSAWESDDPEFTLSAGRVPPSASKNGRFAHAEPGAPERSIPASRLPPDVAPGEEYWIGPFSLRIAIGDLTKTKADAWVSPEDTDFSMSGGASGSIAAHLGLAYRDAVARHRKARAGETRWTATGKAWPKYVVHAVTLGGNVDPGTERRSAAHHSDWDGLPDLDTLDRCLSGVMTTANKIQVRSLALPLIGSGAGRLPTAAVARVICAHAIGRLADSQNSTLTTIWLVAPSASDVLLDAIRKQVLLDAPKELVIRMPQSHEAGHPS